MKPQMMQPMPRLTRRRFLTGLASFTAVGLGTATYAVAIEPRLMLNTTAYAFTPPRWTPGLKLRAAVLADPHVVEPWFPLTRWQAVCDAAQALAPDIIFLLGDFVSGIKFRSGTPAPAAIARIAAGLKAPLGVYAINGNHDWWGDRAAEKARKGPPAMQKALEDAGVPVLANRAVRLVKDGLPFWLSGTDSMAAFRTRQGPEGMDDLAAAWAGITDEAPIIHLAHEPDMFVDSGARAALTLSGHTHGGQITLAGYAPYIPSYYGRRFRYGHIVEDGKHLIVSGGLGTSNIPVRFGVPPEINLVELG